MEHPQNSLEIPRHKNSSADKFCFPIMSVEDQEFEFGSCLTSGSPSSPADHLFLNGRLLPHAFPFQPTGQTFVRPQYHSADALWWTPQACRTYMHTQPNGLVESERSNFRQPTNTNYSVTYSRSTSRTSSVSTKDSLMSSRSNSTNSRNSSCSSARTSTSEVSERKVLINQAKVSSKIPGSYQAKRPVLNRQYSSSQMWQFITPVPVLKHQVSAGSRKSDIVECKKMKSKKQAKKKTSSKAWFGKRFFMSFVSACKECHAIKPSSRTSVSCQAM